MNLGFQWALERRLCYSTGAFLKSSMKLTPAPCPPQFPAANVLYFLRVIQRKLEVVQGFRSLQDCFRYSFAVKLKSSLGKATKTSARLSQPTQSFVFWSSWCHSQYLCAAETDGNRVAVKVSFWRHKFSLDCTAFADCLKSAILLRVGCGQSHGHSDCPQLSLSEWHWRISF